jgi:polygalacturonase
MKIILATLLLWSTASFAQPDKGFNARDYGTAGDGKTKDTAAIQY